MKKLSLLLLMAGLFHLPGLLAAPASIGVISYTEKPAQLIRASELYEGTTGTSLQAGDFIESSSSVLHIEGIAATLLALGPNSRIALTRNAKTTEITLLNGWLKVQPLPGWTRTPLLISTSTLSVDASLSAGVIHADQNLVEVFVEDGTQSLIELDKRGREGRKTSLAHEEYAGRKGEESVSAPGRPPQAFITAMPPSFFDPLISHASKQNAASPAKTPLKKLRDVSFDDVSPWLLGRTGLNQKSLAARFSPRLSDPGFRQAITRQFGGSLEWETELYRFERKSNPR